MGLLVCSTLRHMRMHWKQTLLTTLVTILITGLFSAVFFVVSGFQKVLRERALEENGSYHYRYTEDMKKGGSVLRFMAERFEEDSWFSEVELEERDSALELKLTVASPGIFMSKTMERKFDSLLEEFHRSHPWVQGISTGRYPNHDLLVSYGDLSRTNGIFSFLLIFFALTGILSFASILILGASIGVSKSRREREFALYLSIGADPGQIRNLVLLESVFYILAGIPAGFGVGMLLFHAAKGYVDQLTLSLNQYAPMELVISAPFVTAFVLMASAVILLSGLEPALKAQRISPMELLKRNKEIGERWKPDKKGAKKAGGFDPARHRNVEGWLALKSHRRFKRRYLPLLVMMAVTFMLSFTVSGIEDFAEAVTDLFYSLRNYNIVAEIYGDDREELEQTVAGLGEFSENRFAVVRTASFDIRRPYPLSQLGEEHDWNNGRLPQIVLYSVGDEEYEEILRKLDIKPASLEGMVAYGEDSYDAGKFVTKESGGRRVAGIFLDAEYRWQEDGALINGRLFSLQAGDCVRAYTVPNAVDAVETGIPVWKAGDKAGIDGNRNGTADADGFDIGIVGVLTEIPESLELDENTDLAILIPEGILKEVEALRPSVLYPGSNGLYHVALKGEFEDAYGFERKLRQYLTGYEGKVRIINYEEEEHRKRSNILSFQYLCKGFTMLLILMCIFGNYTVSGSIEELRQKEFAAFLSAGMEQRKLNRMRYYELGLNLLYAFVLGVGLGTVCYGLLYQAFTTEYLMKWRFPFKGMWKGTAILLLIALVSEAIRAFEAGYQKRTLAESLRLAE